MNKCVKKRPDQFTPASRRVPGESPTPKLTEKKYIFYKNFCKNNRPISRSPFRGIIQDQKRVIYVSYFLKKNEIS